MLGRLRRTLELEMTRTAIVLVLALVGCVGAGFALAQGAADDPANADSAREWTAVEDDDPLSITELDEVTGQTRGLDIYAHGDGSRMEGAKTIREALRRIWPDGPPDNVSGAFRRIYYGGNEGASGSDE